MIIAVYVFHVGYDTCPQQEVNSWVLKIQIISLSFNKVFLKIQNLCLDIPASVAVAHNSQCKCCLQSKSYSWILSYKGFVINDCYKARFIYLLMFRFMKLIPKFRIICHPSFHSLWKPFCHQQNTSLLQEKTCKVRTTTRIILPSQLILF